MSLYLNLVTQARSPADSQLHLARRFVSIDPLYTPTADGKQDNIFITKSYDATTHFETVAEDVADVWERITVSNRREAGKTRRQRADFSGTAFSIDGRARSSPWRRATSRFKDRSDRSELSLHVYLFCVCAIPFQ